MALEKKKAEKITVLAATKTERMLKARDDHEQKLYTKFEVINKRKEREL